MRRSVLVDEMFGPDIESPAADLLDKAWEAKTPAARRKAARKALAADLDCIDAYNVLALSAESAAESIALLREGVRIGDRLFAPVIEEPDMHWWGFIGTRPYMRAMHNLGLALDDVGDQDEAEQIYRRLLVMNPDDNQGVRSLVIKICMESDRLDDMRELIAQYPDDFLLEMQMASLFVEMRAGKPAAVLKSRASEIDKRNTFVLAQLAGLGRGESEIDRSPYGIAVGGEDEALEYAERFRPIWVRRKAMFNAITRYFEK